MEPAIAAALSRLEKSVRLLEADNKTPQADYMALRNENKELKADKEELRVDNADLNAKIKAHGVELSEVNEYVAALIPVPATAKDYAGSWRALLLFLGVLCIALSIIAKRYKSEKLAWASRSFIYFIYSCLVAVT